MVSDNLITDLTEGKIQMICTYCGGKYSKTALTCPFCHSENKVMAEKQKKKILGQYDIEAENMMKTVPKKVVRKGTKWIFITGLSLAGLVVVIFIIAVLSGKIWGDISYDKQNTYKQQLEQYFQNQDLEGLCHYMKEQGLNGYYYTKYDQVKTAYEYLSEIQFRLEEATEIMQNATWTEAEKKELSDYYVRSMIQYFQKLCIDCKKYIGDGAIPENDILLKQIQEEAMSIFLDLGFGEEEIDTFTTADQLSDNEEKSNEILNEIVDRIKNHLLQGD